jgi:hypothetical protein
MPKLTIDEMHEIGDWMEIDAYWQACECKPWDPDPKVRYEGFNEVSHLHLIAELNMGIC